MHIFQGDIFWVEISEPSGSEPGYRHPHVVIQNNIFNKSNINTVIVCTLTTNIRRANCPGNVLLMPGEGNLPEQSVVNVTQLYTVDKRDLVKKIGSLSIERINEILEGIDLVLKSR
jgi:mRNA interferase MazF